MRSLVLIAHNLRSAHNVGSLLRIGDGLAVERLYLTGYTPYPHAGDKDGRLPHLAVKLDRQIAKTALGAERSTVWRHAEDINKVISRLKRGGYLVAALERAPGSIQLPAFDPPPKLALVVGREVEGLEPEVLAACDLILEIPMLGDKESFNVASAAAMALYHLRFS